ncbi:MAG TPA: DUF1285 domain-containing protein, partial [Caulobacteraceae bacterium]
MATPSADSSLARLFEAVGAAAASDRGPAPVHLWNPAACGDIDIRIGRDGAWFYQGSPIGRPGLVRLFSTVLRRDEDGFWLVTPVEKLRIAVEDAPFVAIGVEREGEVVRFATNVGDLVEAGPLHPIRVEAGENGAPRPYVRVRGGLDALIGRPAFYDLVAM